jgi:hypothetical protein
MTKQSDLNYILGSMTVWCDDMEYGFALLTGGEDLTTKEIIGTFQEKEGLTVIAGTDYLKAKNLEYEGPFAKLSIDVHTSLNLVGLTAVLASELAKQDIPANVVAAYYHDHIFVRYDQREAAITALTKLKGSR